MGEFISQKRKRSSSSQNPFVGTFTRSKSRIYLHCHRSGRARSDSFRHSKFHAELRSNSAVLSSNTCNKKCTQKSLTAETSDSTKMDDWSSILIKDLRTRRVFSLHSATNDNGFCVGSEEENAFEKKKEAIEDVLCSDSTKIESTNSSSLIDKEDMVAECLDRRKVGEKKIDVEFCSQEQNNADLQVAEGNAGSCVDGESSAEECVQATPPDAEILQKLPIASDDHGPKSVLSSRSRVKVFKVPYSFSYRRLLPYLMGMEQDNSSTAATGNCSNVENQPLTIDNAKVDGHSMEALAGESGSHDVQNFPDEVSAQHIVDSAILIPTQKDSSTIVSSPTSLDDELCLKRFFGSSNENIEKGVSSEYENLGSPIRDCSPKLHNPHINGDFNESKPLDGEESVKKHQLSEDDEVGRGTCCTMQTESVGIEAFYLRCNDKTIGANHVSSVVSREEGNGTKEEGNDNVASKLDDSNEESNRMTPPDVDIFEGIEFVLQRADQVLERPVNGSFPHNGSYFADKRTNSNSKRKLGLSPRSQLKLFKIGSSLNYRRLLPYLMDIAKDNSGDSRNGHSPTLQKSVEENLVSPLSMSVVHETPSQKLNSKSIHLEKNNDSCIIQMAKQASNHESGCMQSRSAAPDKKTENLNSVVMEKEQELKVINLISDDQIQNLAHGSSPDTMSMSSSIVSPFSCAVDVVDPVLHVSSANNEDDYKKSRMVGTNASSPVEAGSSSLSQNSYKLQASGPLEIAVNGSRKGILKRSPRGCRGPCTCLNCASFRLNAERAFEFSKNQMQDAEEVALELIEELSHLQNMLGGAASVCSDNVVIPIDQVKMACMRACEAQELAKSRLAHMNYDLNIHCRTTDGHRPRVKFANNVEQRMISNAPK